MNVKARGTKAVCSGAASGRPINSSRMVAHNALSPWETFFFLVGSSGAALTGLQFVVVALVAESEMRTGPREIAAFGTPTIVHFCAVLLVAATLSAPWPGLWGPATAVGIYGILGITYALIITRRAQRTTNYKPVLEDWIWHTVLPFSAYVVLTVAAVALPRYDMPALFAMAGSVLLLLFIGIHNAWDTVTYVALMPQNPPSTDAAAGQPPASSEPTRGTPTTS